MRDLPGGRGDPGLPMPCRDSWNRSLVGECVMARFGIDPAFIVICERDICDSCQEARRIGILGIPPTMRISVACGCDPELYNWIMALQELPNTHVHVVVGDQTTLDIIAEMTKDAQDVQVRRR